MPPKRKSSSSNKKKSVSKKAKAVAEEVKAESSNNVELPVAEEFLVDEEALMDEETLMDEEALAVEAPVAESSSRISPRRSSEKRKAVKDDEEESRFIGEPVPDTEARERWSHRYQSKKKVVTEPANGTVSVKEYTQAKRHYTKALVDGRVRFKLGDDGYVYAGEDQEPYICRVVEMFEGVDGFPYFCAQWFYRAKDTIIQVCSNLIDDRRIFLSEIRDDNPLDCLLEKLKIVRVPLDKDQATKRALLGNGNYYYDMSYLVPFSSYQNLPPDNEADGNESDSTISSESESNSKTVVDVSKTQEDKKTEMRMLDLYSGCGAMSTGLCLGANLRVIAESLSEEEIAGLREMFKAMDTDNSGAITFDELKAGLRKFGSTLKDTEIRDLMDAADVDNSGTIDYGEFVAATIHLNKLEREEHLVAAFQYFDKDGSGYITVDELQQACADHNMTDFLVEDIIREVDQDNDGRIDYGEFVAMMTKGNAGVGRRTMRNSLNMSMRDAPGALS